MHALNVWLCMLYAFHYRIAIASMKHIPGIRAKFNDSLLAHKHEMEIRFYDLTKGNKRERIGTRREHAAKFTYPHMVLVSASRLLHPFVTLQSDELGKYDDMLKGRHSLITGR